MQQTGYMPVWREAFRVHSGDVGFHGKTRISNICRYFQEAAGRHAEHLGVGYTNMRAAGLAWVLTRLTLEIKDVPRWGQEFYVETWPLASGRILFRRDYRVVCGEETIVSASSWWIPFDLSSRRPRMVEIDAMVLKTNEGRYGIAGDFVRIAPVTGTPPEEGFTARYTDLDQNHHVNNTRYVEWVFDHLGTEVPARGPASFSIEYKQEIKQGESLLLRKCADPDDPSVILVEGLTADSRQISLRARIVF